MRTSGFTPPPPSSAIAPTCRPGRCAPTPRTPSVSCRTSSPPPPASRAASSRARSARRRPPARSCWWPRPGASPSARPRRSRPCSTGRSTASSSPRCARARPSSRACPRGCAPSCSTPRTSCTAAACCPTRRRRATAIELLLAAGIRDGILLLGYDAMPSARLFRSATVAARVRGIRGHADRARASCTRSRSGCGPRPATSSRRACSLGGCARGPSCASTTGWRSAPSRRWGMPACAYPRTSRWCRSTTTSSPRTCVRA